MTNTKSYYEASLLRVLEHSLAVGTHCNGEIQKLSLNNFSFHVLQF